jgi:hypothetical protein
VSLFNVLSDSGTSQILLDRLSLEEKEGKFVTAI